METTYEVAAAGASTIQNLNSLKTFTYYLVFVNYFLYTVQERFARVTAEPSAGKRDLESLQFRSHSVRQNSDGTRANNGVAAW